MTYSNEYKKEILRRMSNGMKQYEISQDFKQKKITPSSLSSIEKAIKEARTELHAKNDVHMIAKAIRLGAIK